MRIYAALFFAGETQDRRGHERGDGEDEARKRIEFKSALHLICFVFRPEFRRQVLEDERSRARQVIDDGEYTVRRQVQKEKLGLTDWYRLVQIGTDWYRLVWCITWCMPSHSLWLG